QEAAIRRGEGEGGLRGVLDDELARVARAGGDLVDVVDSRAALILVEEESAAVGVPALEAGGLARREIGLPAVQLPDEEMLQLSLRPAEKEPFVVGKVRLDEDRLPRRARQRLRSPAR